MHTQLLDRLYPKKGVESIGAILFLLQYPRIPRRELKAEKVKAHLKRSGKYPKKGVERIISSTLLRLVILCIPRRELKGI